MQIASWALALALMVLPGTALAQAHEKQFGDFTLRSSTVGSESLSPHTAREHGIRPSPRRAILNVTVKKDGQTIPARVSAVGRSLTGKKREIGMRETIANNYVSYTGSYEFTHGEVIDFTVTAIPRGSETPLTLTYRERMWAKGDLPEAATR